MPEAGRAFLSDRGARPVRRGSSGKA